MTAAREPSQVTLRVGIRKLRTDLTYYLRQVREGKAVLITSRNAVVAELRPPTLESRAPRPSGLLRGKIRIADDFNTLPDDVLDAMER